MEKIENNIISPVKFNQEGETPLDYRSTAKRIHNSLLKLEQKVKQGEVYSYGSYKEQNSKGEDFVVENIAWDTDINSFRVECEEKIVILALDYTTNRVVGLRYVDVGKRTLNYDRIPKYSREVAGDINNKVRGKGVGTVLDTVLIKVLEKVVLLDKQKGQDTEIIWHVENANLRKLEKLENATNLSEQEQLQLEEKRKEQKRWQSLYGENGKFGFRKIPGSEVHYEKVITPLVEGDVTDEYKIPITLERYKELLNKLKESFN